MGSRSRNGGGGAWVSMALKAAIASAGVVTAAMAIRLAGPPAVWFLAAEVPRAYDSALAWLRPPYLYLVINGIIISIAASSRFQKRPSTATADLTPLPHLATMDPVAVVQEPVEYEAKLAEDAPTAEVYGRANAEAEDEEVEEEFVISRSSWSPKRRSRETMEEIPTEYSVAAAEKPLVSTRFSHRKAVKPSPDGSYSHLPFSRFVHQIQIFSPKTSGERVGGKALGVARRPRRNETLETTWRTITEGRAVPLARHLKKSDTWDTRGSGGEEEAEAKAAVMRKSETFNERGAAAASPKSGESSGGRLRREASLGQDELNRRVEAFIRKFNEEMRLQRQESMKHYMEMINRDRR
ncbi:fiber expressed protein [Musa troglodytarum]|uniref:Fiber expressed protein n=1 Tax=Musa troglodytarum TaxID=320322 RepID=A0A9E7F222_9LILI|nr:fiber expressed protein [Musa troglodytarum]